MNTVFLANAPAAGGNNFMMLGLFVVLIAITYFGMIRPQKKQQQKRMEMMNQLKKGDRVVLVDGLHAKIDSINDKDKTVVVDADGIYLTFSRMAVRQIVPSTPASAEPAKPAEAQVQATEASQPTKPVEAEKAAENDEVNK
ncbi:preprotein translocase subunit YajC [Lactobacillus hamsteri]|uniref:preprotein translocase subunit YajC n=1 Tax=Lactobacillus hamsteri TaxID=96565 RepID=UPI0004687579|nr:preprotein translocase subunit YajC [Lactobacillus hamsteri]